MWKDSVFQVDDGEVRHPTDPINRAFVADLAKGWVPEELRERSETGAPVPVHINVKLPLPPPNNNNTPLSPLGYITRLCIFAQATIEQQSSIFEVAHSYSLCSAQIQLEDRRQDHHREATVKKPDFKAFSGGGYSLGKDWLPEAQNKVQQGAAVASSAAAADAPTSNPTVLASLAPDESKPICTVQVSPDILQRCAILLASCKCIESQISFHHGNIFEVAVRPQISRRVGASWHVFPPKSNVWVMLLTDPHPCDWRSCGSKTQLDKDCGGPQKMGGGQRHGRQRPRLYPHGRCRSPPSRSTSYRHAGGG